MLLPYGTDTPIYHWPYATIVLIVVNILVFSAQGFIPAEKVDQQELEQLLGQDDDEKLDLGANEMLALLNGELLERPGWMRLALSHGDGLHPVQWLTSFFIHGGILHLIGNMIFLGRSD